MVAVVGFEPPTALASPKIASYISHYVFYDFYRSSMFQYKTTLKFKLLYLFIVNGLVRLLWFSEIIMSLQRFSSALHNFFSWPVPDVEYGIYHDKSVSHTIAQSAPRCTADQAVKTKFD